MRKAAAAAFVALLLTLALASTAFAVDLTSSRHPDGGPPGDQARAKAMQPRAHFVPLGVKLAGNAVVNGHVYDYEGTALGSSYAYWTVPVDTAWEWGDVYTDAAGAHRFSGLPAASGNGYLQVENLTTEPW